MLLVDFELEFLNSKAKTYRQATAPDQALKYPLCANTQDGELTHLFQVVYYHMLSDELCVLF